jgi:hypothetical protein
MKLNVGWSFSKVGRIPWLLVLCEEVTNLIEFIEHFFGEGADVVDP